LASDFFRVLGLEVCVLAATFGGRLFITKTTQLELNLKVHKHKWIKVLKTICNFGFELSNLALMI